MYKADKNSVSVFGFRTQFGGGKSTGFALIYDSHDDLKKFEPHYRKVRYGDATKIEKPSRQQRMSLPSFTFFNYGLAWVANASGDTGKQRKNKGKEVRGTHGKKVSKDKK